MKNQWRLITGIVVITIIILFSILNVDAVPVNFGFGKVDAPTILIILVSLLLGSILTVLVSTTANMTSKKEIKSLRSKVDNHEIEMGEAINRTKKEQEDRIVKLEETVKQKDNKIQSLENELINQFTHGQSNPPIG